MLLNHSPFVVIAFFLHCTAGRELVIDHYGDLYQENHGKATKERSDIITGYSASDSFQPHPKPKAKHGRGAGKVPAKSRLHVATSHPNQIPPLHQKQKQPNIVLIVADDLG